jgi:uncharacterized integral membrane protein
LWITSLDKSDKTTCSNSVKIRFVATWHLQTCCKLITNSFDLFTAYRIQTLFIVWLIRPWKAVSSIILSLYTWIFNNEDVCILNQKVYFAVFSRLYSYFWWIKLDELKWTAVEKFLQVANEIRDGPLDIWGGLGNFSVHEFF